ncbi:MAG: hypothetical protein AAF799_23600 [Myxococcota bacterium]
MIPSLILCAALVVAPPAESSLRDELVAEAVEHFGAQRYQAAIEGFERAYELEHQAVDLYNIGRVYEEFGKVEKAREHYERFLARPNLTETERSEGQARLAALPDPEVAPAPPAPQEPTSRRERRRQRRQSNKDRDPRRTNGVVIAGSTFIPLGVLSLASGTAVGITAIRNIDNARASATPEVPIEQTPHYRLARRSAIVADALLIGGGVVAAAGIVMVAAGLERKPRRKKRRRRNVEVVAAPAGAGFEVEVRF